MKFTTIGLPQILLVVFVVLKLVGVITWSWVWVLSPLWISFGFFIFILLFLILILGISTTIKVLNEKS